MFHRLHQTWGPQHWWPAETAFEMIVGAYLTQNTAWTNVELALGRLRTANALTIDGVRRTPIAELEELVRPAGYFRQKAARLKQFVQHLDAKYGLRAKEAQGLLQTERDEHALVAMLSRPTNELRDELLGLNGIGPETADSILLYAGLHPIFVVDAYTKRIFSRHELVSDDATYEEVRVLVETALCNEQCAQRASNCTERSEEQAFHPPVHAPSALSQLTRSESAQAFAEFHGLLVQVGKHFCLKQQPRCEDCPLKDMLPKPLKPKRKP
jgi:endonuclease-3 related protein